MGYDWSEEGTKNESHLGSYDPSISLRESPTQRQFATLQKWFDHLNSTLFERELKPCLLNLSRIRGRGLARGFFAPKRWESVLEASELFYEISLTPDTLHGRTEREVASTLAHEMVHLWQEQFGRPGRRGYHNREWASKMMAIGLIPTSTGAPGGRMIGERVTHYILEGGAFARAWEQLEDGDKLPFTCTEGKPVAIPVVTSTKIVPEARPKRNKVKYTCSCCETNVWGKAGLSLVCGSCQEAFVFVG